MCECFETLLFSPKSRMNSCERKHMVCVPCVSLFACSSIQSPYFLSDAFGNEMRQGFREKGTVMTIVISIRFVRYQRLGWWMHRTDLSYQRRTNVTIVGMTRNKDGWQGPPARSQQEGSPGIENVQGTFVATVLLPTPNASHQTSGLQRNDSPPNITFND
jgi:hypothetical protein